MPTFARQRGQAVSPRSALAAGLLVLVPSACAVPTEAAIHDLAAIHQEGAWEARDPAPLAVAPNDWVRGVRVETSLRIGDERLYEVPDHRGLELVLLDAIAQTPAGRFEDSLEATAWLSILLLHDDHAEARLRAATILAQSFAGPWVDRYGARLPEPEPSGDLTAAVAAYTRATNADDPAGRETIAEAIAGIDAAAFDDPLVAARLSAGLGRRLRVAPLATGEDSLARIGLRTVVAALEAGSAASDPEVAEACAERLQLIRDYARAER